MSDAQLIALGYFSAIAVAAAVEAVSPLRRPQPAAMRRRWTVNIALAVIDTVVIRLLWPVTLIEIAVLASDSRYAILPAADLPWWLAAAVTFIALDAGKYAQHVALHRVPWLWRFHAAHHTDRDYDFTTGLRFHPIEAVLTVGLDLGLIAILGGPVEAVLAYEIARIALSILAHANLRLPDAADRVLRLVLVTPNAHRLHHAVDFQDGDCNLATVFTWWDRIAGSWHALPPAALPAMAIGLPGAARSAPDGLIALLLQPLTRSAVAGRPDS